MPTARLTGNRPMTNPCPIYSDHAAGDRALTMHRSGDPARAIAESLGVSTYQARNLIKIAERREHSIECRRAMLKQWKSEGRTDLLEGRSDLHLLQG